MIAWNRLTPVNDCRPVSRCDRPAVGALSTLRPAPAHLVIRTIAAGPNWTHSPPGRPSMEIALSRILPRCLSRRAPIFKHAVNVHQLSHHLQLRAEMFWMTMVLQFIRIRIEVVQFPRDAARQGHRGRLPACGSASAALWCVSGGRRVCRSPGIHISPTCARGSPREAQTPNRDHARVRLSEVLSRRVSFGRCRECRPCHAL